MKLHGFLEEKKRGYRKKMKQLKRKAFFLKARLFLTFVLPVVIILLTVKVIKTLLRMKLREAASSVLPHEEPVRQPVTQTAQKPEFVTPVPVDTSL